MKARVFFGLIFAALLSGGMAGLFFGGIGIIFTVPLAVAFALVLGLPIYFLLRHFGWLRHWQITLAGVCCASPALLGMPLHPYFALVVLLSGALGGWLFWVAAVGPN